ncbi:hypothetical protein Tco_1262919 [Tanacetum coccineum]
MGCSYYLFSSYSSEECVGFHAPRVILFGAIPAIIHVILEVLIVPADPIVVPEEETVSVISPTGVLDLVDYSSSSDSDPLEDSLPPIPDLPLVSPSGSSSLDTLAPSSDEAFRRWRSVPLSIPYLPTTSESSLGSSSERSLDSSTPSSGPSRKRYRFPTASVPSPTHVSRSIAPTPADLLPPCKRFRDSYSLEDSREEHMEVDTADAEAVADVGISDGVVAHTRDGVGMRVEITASDVREDDEEFEAEASAADTREIVVDPLAIEVRIDRITEIETTQRQLETSQLVASRERASLVERIGSLRLEYLRVRSIDGVSSVRRDRDDTRRRLRRLESYVERHLGKITVCKHWLRDNNVLWKSSTHVEPSPYTPNLVTIIPGPAGVVQLSNSICVEPSSSTPNPVRIIPGPAGLVQRSKLPKENVFILDPDGALMSTQEYMQKVVEDVGEDADFNSGAWVSATNFVNAFGGTVTGCLGDIDNFLKKGKLEQVVAIVKSCSPNALGDLNVTLKDLSGTVPETIHYKVLDITVGAAMILANVSVFTPKPSKHYLNITKRNVVRFSVRIRFH